MSRHCNSYGFTGPTRRQQAKMSKALGGGLMVAIAVVLIPLAFALLKASEGVYMLFSMPKDGNASALEIVTVLAFLVLATLGVMKL